MVTTPFNGQQITVSRVAGADLSSAQYKNVKLNDSGEVILCSSSGELAFGVLQNAPTSGGAALVCVEGVTKVIAGAAITLSGITQTMTNASGLTITATSSNKPTGVALMPAAASSDVISIYFRANPVALA